MVAQPLRFVKQPWVVFGGRRRSCDMIDFVTFFWGMVLGFFLGGVSVISVLAILEERRRF